MRKRSLVNTGLVLVMLVSFTFIATSCSWFGGGEEEVVFESNVQEKRVGVLKSLGGMSVGEGTHLLELEDKSTMRLKSDNIDLDSEKYLGEKVEVRGPLAVTSDGKDIMDVRSIDIAEDEDAEEEVIGVETDYTNAKLGIHITYLDSWELTEEDTNVIFTAPQAKPAEEEPDEDSALEDNVNLPKQDIVVIERIPNPEKKDLAMFLQLPSDTAEMLTLGYNQTLVGTDQLDGLKKESGDRNEIDIWLTRGEYVYKFTFLGSEHQDVAKNRNTFFSMIASFKFVGILEDEEEEEVDDEATFEDIETEEEPQEELDTANNLEPEEDDSPTFEDTDTEEDLPEINYETSTESGSVYSLIAEYIGDEINTLAPESSENGSWSAYSFEFADPNYVYADYTDGTDYRRILISYEHDGSTFNTNIEAYFEPGETTSWERVSGDNPVENAEKTIVELTDDGASEATVVKEGYRYFESLPYDFLAQYPSNWYFSGTSGGDGVIHHYGFSNEPVENGNELVSIDIVSGSAPSGSSISVGSNTGVKVYENGEVAIYIAREDGTLYKIHGDSGYESSVIDIAASITAN